MNERGTTPLNPHDYPQFSEAEFERRRGLLLDIMAQHDLPAVVVYGERSAGPVTWFTGWHPTHMAAAIVLPSDRIELLVQRFNHVATATRMVSPSVDVRFGGGEGVGEVLSTVHRRVPAASQIGWIGPLSASTEREFARAGLELVSLGSPYQALRLLKSEEELDWMRRGVGMTDAGLDALMKAIVPGVSEWALAAAVEGAYLEQGGTNHLHYFCSTPMSDPSRYVPAQLPSGRELRTGDAVVTELSASFWGYPGQVLRTITVNEPPNALYEELHAVAEMAYRAVAGTIRAGVSAADLVAAADVIADAGYVLGDDLVHGFGGGYLPPVLRTRQDEIDPVPDLRLEARMTIVVQPNVCTPDRRAGVQTGELLLVTETGSERLHTAPMGLLVATP